MDIRSDCSTGVPAESSVHDSVWNTQLYKAEVNLQKANVKKPPMGHINPRPNLSVTTSVALEVRHLVIRIRAPLLLQFLFLHTPVTCVLYLLTSSQILIKLSPNVRTREASKRVVIDASSKDTPTESS